MIRLIMLTILIGIFVACKEETTIKKAPKIDGTWISNTKPTITLYIWQEKTNIVGSAEVEGEPFPFDVIGMNDYPKIIIHLIDHFHKHLAFTGVLKNDTLKGTIKENLTVTEIEFIKN